MGDEHIQRAPVLQAVQGKMRQEAEGSQVGFRLRVLVCSVGAVANTAAEPPDEKLPMARQFQVEVRAAFCVGEGIVGVVIWIMVAGHVKEGNVQQAYQIFKVGVGQVAATEDGFDIVELSVRAKVVQAFDDFITNGEDLHGLYCAVKRMRGQGEGIAKRSDDRFS